MRTRRETTRAATVREIKNTALARMRLCGSADIRLSDVARDMQMSAPGLYRYFDGRDGLLTALIADAFTELARQVERALDDIPVKDAGCRLLAVARTYRQWALDHREQFALIFGPPVTGYAAPQDGPTKEAAKRAMDSLRRLITDADEQGVRTAPRFTALPPSLTAAAPLPESPDAEPATELAISHLWAGLHGFVTLEAFGQLDWHPDDVRESTFLGLVRLLAEAVGLPAPLDGWPPGTPA